MQKCCSAQVHVAVQQQVLQRGVPFMDSPNPVMAHVGRMGLHGDCMGLHGAVERN